MTQVAPAALDGCRVLVAEDEYTIAREVAGVLAEAGAEALGPAATVAKALAIAAAEAGRIDAALLDVNLRGEAMWPVADAVLAHSVPVVLATGYDVGAIPTPTPTCRAARSRRPGATWPAPSLARWRRSLPPRAEGARLAWRAGGAGGRTQPARAYPWAGEATPRRIAPILAAGPSLSQATRRTREASSQRRVGPRPLPCPPPLRAAPEAAGATAVIATAATTDGPGLVIWPAVEGDGTTPC